MRALMNSAMGTLLCLMLVSTATAAQPSSEAGPEELGLTRDEAVALVLATDPRYADLPDFRRLEIESSADFDLGIKFGSDYYRVLPTLPTQYLGQGFIDFHYPGNWVIEATLVRDCVSISEALDPTVGLRDPCEWRHSWFYRVQPDGTVSLLFDEGDE
jgi:hypothetical protein